MEDGQLVSATVTPNANLLTIEKGLKDLSTRITTAPTEANIGNPASLGSRTTSSTASLIVTSIVLTRRTFPLM